MPRKTAVKLEKRTAERMIRNSKYLDKRPRNFATADDPPADFGGSCVMRVTVACNPGAGATPGINGRGVMQNFNGTTYSDGLSTAFPIVNDSDKTVAVGAYVLCSPSHGLWHLVVAKCADLS